MQANNIDDINSDSPDQNTPEPFGVVNIKELKKKKPKKAKREDDHLWFNQLKYWMLISIVPTAIALIIGYFYRAFLILAGVFPVVAIISWFVRKIFRDNEIDKEEWLK